MHKIEIISTKDGSKTLFVPELNETYHSKHGALTESKHVYIEMGLKFVAEQGVQPINILEIGFGTGLNWFLALEFAKNQNLSINYETLEKFPIPLDAIGNYFDNIADFETIDTKAFHVMPWGEKTEVEKDINFLKHNIDIHDFRFIENQYHIIFFDAFAPNKQPEMWSENILSQMFDTLKNEGVLVTYCAQGEFKRTLKKVRFQVQTIPGPPFKKEMTRAIKP